MPRTNRSRRHINTWIRQAKREGLYVCEDIRELFVINGKTTRIMYSDSNTPWFRFHLGIDSMNDEGSSPVDVIVFLCERQEVFYCIPRRVMVGLRRNVAQRQTANPRIWIDVEKDVLHFRRTLNVSRYRNSRQTFTSEAPTARRKKSFESQVRNWLHKNFHRRRGVYVKSEKTIQGASGNTHRIDHMIYGPCKPSSRSANRILVEVKNPGKKGREPSPSTYYVHMVRAFMTLADFDLYRKWLKFVLVPRRQKYGKRDFDRFFNPMNIHLVAFHNRRELKAMKRAIKDAVR